MPNLHAGQSRLVVFVSSLPVEGSDRLGIGLVRVPGGVLVDHRSSQADRPDHLPCQPTEAP